uniref:OTU domain-containing protein n=1 Tax=Branchiostoma floridae TaxID=7739 RepID=C3Y888_BRAFL|eukprot:XP_002607547.1 hypothetical protein BRAFLDRAFT_131418 [Branchiostoma floridae]
MPLPRRRRNVPGKPHHDDMEQILSNLAAENLVVRDFIAADENCQFSAVSDQVTRLGRGNMTVNCLREIVLQHLKNNPGQKSDSSEIDKYLEDGRKEGADDVVGYRIWQATAAVRASAKAQREQDDQRPTCKELTCMSAARGSWI